MIKKACTSSQSALLCCASLRAAEQKLKVSCFFFSKKKDLQALKTAAFSERAGQQNTYFGLLLLPGDSKHAGVPLRLPGDSAAVAKGSYGPAEWLALAQCLISC
ncbi:MAG: hypothetical protein Q4B50_01845 [Bacillota bacterium]|nr:hypothetical protein [Bacillota bacterium]